MSGNACGTPGCPAPSLGQWAALHADLGEIKGSLREVDRRLARLEETTEETADGDTESLLAQIAAFKAAEAKRADFRRDIGKAVAIALLSAALGVLGGAAAKGAPKASAGTTPYVAGAGGAPPHVNYPPPPAP